MQNEGWLIEGDCLEKMKDIPDGSVDMILADLPYGTTACKWDVVIPFEPLWEQYWRVLKHNGAIVLFSQQPFTTELISSNRDDFRYIWIWIKNRVTGHAHANRMPMKNTEDLCVFYKKLPTYNPQGLQDCVIDQRRKTKEYGGLVNPNMKGGIQTKTGYPRTTLQGFSSVFKTIHPNEKPTSLLEYLIKTYTNEGDTVLDNVMGSGSTGVACVNTGRRFIGIEKEEKYFQIARERISDAILEKEDIFKYHQ